MTELMAVLAFFIALAALYLVSDVTKRVEAQNKQFAENYINSLKNSVTDCRRTIGTIGEELAALSKLVGEIANGQARAGERFTAVDKAMEALKAQIGELDASIPSKYRVARPEKTASPKPLRN
jgi:peptidoglycan hydrolase CwlO-like protein